MTIDRFDRDSLPRQTAETGDQSAVRPAALSLIRSIALVVLVGLAILVLFPAAVAAQAAIGI
jgi:hypothetical protein